MKKIYVIILSLGLSYLSAQKEVKIEDLAAPNSPGFILLDEAPTSIERPTTPKAFVFSIVNTIVQNNGIPTNYAAEFTPFWFFQHKDMETIKFYGWNSKKNRQNIFHSARLTSFSISYSQKKREDTLSIKNHHVSLGINIPLIRVYSKEKYYKQLLNQIDSVNPKLAIIVNKKTDLSMDILNLKDEIDTLNQISQSKPEEAKNNEIKILEIKKKINAKEEEILKLDKDYIDENNLKSFKEILKRKPVFSLDIACASTMNFDSSNVNSAKLGKAGIWVTGSLQFKLDKDKEKNNYLGALFCGRYILDNTIFDSTKTRTLSHMLDIGLKAELELNRFLLSCEGLYRLNTTLPTLNTFRINGVLKYKVNNTIYLTAAFGRNFGATDNLIATIGINLGINSGNETTKTVIPN